MQFLKTLSQAEDLFLKIQDKMLKTNRHTKEKIELMLTKASK